MNFEAKSTNLISQNLGPSILNHTNLKQKLIASSLRSWGTFYTSRASQNRTYILYECIDNIIIYSCRSSSANWKHSTQLSYLKIPFRALEYVLCFYWRHKRTACGPLKSAALLWLPARSNSKSFPHFAVIRILCYLLAKYVLCSLFFALNTYNFAFVLWASITCSLAMVPCSVAVWFYLLFLWVGVAIRVHSLYKRFGEQTYPSRKSLFHPGEIHARFPPQSCWIRLPLPFFPRFVISFLRFQIIYLFWSDHLLEN